MQLAIRIVLGLTIALILLVLIVFGVGAALPRNHSVSLMVVIPAAPDTVWAVITDWEHSPAWRTDVKRVERLPDHDGHEVWKQIADEGSWPLELVEQSPPTRLVAVVADSSQGFGGAWTYALAPEGAGTRVTLTEDGFVDNPAFRFLATYVFGMRSTMDGYLAGLARRFGATAKPAPPR